MRIRRSAQRRCAPCADELTRWFASIFGLPSEAFGIVVSGGAMANFVALKAARDAATRFTSRVDGLQGRQLAFHASQEAHDVIDRATDMLGMGTCAVRRIEVDAAFRMRGDLLDKIWFHVDGAYGAAGALSEALRPLYAGSNGPTRSPSTRINGSIRLIRAAASSSAIRRSSPPRSRWTRHACGGKSCSRAESSTSSRPARSLAGASRRSRSGSRSWPTGARPTPGGSLTMSRSPATWPRASTGTPISS